MEIQGPGGVSGPGRAELPRIAAAETEATDESPQIADRVEVSAEARWLEKLAEVPPLRLERIAELQKLIEAGEYESAERIESAVAKLLEEL